jgi:hypothetical protein
MGGRKEDKSRLHSRLRARRELSCDCRARVICVSCLLSNCHARLIFELIELCGEDMQDIAHTKLLATFHESASAVKGQRHG